VLSSSLPHVNSSSVVVLECCRVPGVPGCGRPRWAGQDRGPGRLARLGRAPRQVRPPPGPGCPPSALPAAERHCWGSGGRRRPGSHGAGAVRTGVLPARAACSSDVELLQATGWRVPPSTWGISRRA